MRSHPRASILASVAVAVLVGGASAGPVLAGRYEPVGLHVASFDVTDKTVGPLDAARVGIIIEFVGAGVIDCLHNVACHAKGDDEESLRVRQSMAVTLDTATGRVRGRIVIDVIDAGFSADGSVVGTLSRRAGSGRWDLAAEARVQAAGGQTATFDLHGLFDRDSPDQSIRDLRGDGRILSTYYDESPVR